MKFNVFLRNIVFCENPKKILWYPTCDPAKTWKTRTETTIGGDAEEIVQRTRWIEEATDSMKSISTPVSRIGKD